MLIFRIYATCPHRRIASSRADMYYIITLYFNEQLVGRLAYSWRQPRGGIAYGDDDDGLFCLWHLEKLMAALGVEVTNPT